MHGSFIICEAACTEENFYLKNGVQPDLPYLSTIRKYFEVKRKNRSKKLSVTMTMIKIEILQIQCYNYVECTIKLMSLLNRTSSNSSSIA